MHNTSEVLNTAADLIEREGWFSLSGGGGAGHCAANAISFAAGTYSPAHTVFAVHIGGTQRTDLQDIWAWNDAAGRTQTEVIEALRAAALIEAAREEQDAAWTTYADAVTA